MMKIILISCLVTLALHAATVAALTGPEKAIQAFCSIGGYDFSRLAHLPVSNQIGTPNYLTSYGLRLCGSANTYPCNGTVSADCMLCSYQRGNVENVECVATYNDLAWSHEGKSFHFVARNGDRCRRTGVVQGLITCGTQPVSNLVIDDHDECNVVVSFQSQFACAAAVQPQCSVGSHNLFPLSRARTQNALGGSNYLNLYGLKMCGVVEESPCNRLVGCMLCMVDVNGVPSCMAYIDSEIKWDQLSENLVQFQTTGGDACRGNGRVTGYVNCVPTVLHENFEVNDKDECNIELSFGSMYGCEVEALAGTLGFENLRAPLLVLDEIARDNFNNRSTGLTGFNESVRYVVRTIETETNFRITRQYFTSGTGANIRYAQNIFADTLTGDPTNTILVGAHLDSIRAGINDDGTGSASILAMALELHRLMQTDWYPPITNRVRFVWFGGEEQGLIGSNFMSNQANVSRTVGERIQDFAIMIDIDMIGSPNYYYAIYNGYNPPSNTPASARNGSAVLAQMFIDRTVDHGMNWTYVSFDGRSDYAGFLRLGVPAGGLFTGAEVRKSALQQEMFGGTAGVPFDICYHQLCDTYSNVNMTAMINMSRVSAHIVENLAFQVDIRKYLSVAPPRTLPVNWDEYISSLPANATEHTSLPKTEGVSL